MRTNPFVCTVCRFADGTPSGHALRAVERTLAVGRDDPGAPVQEPPIGYKLVHACRLPLRGRRGHVHGLHWLVHSVDLSRRKSRVESRFR